MKRYVISALLIAACSPQLASAQTNASAANQARQQSDNRMSECSRFSRVLPKLQQSLALMKTTPDAFSADGDDMKPKMETLVTDLQDAVDNVQKRLTGCEHIKYDH